MLAPATPTILGFKAREIPQGPDHVEVIETANCVDVEPALTGGHSPLKLPLYSLFRPKGG